jgi:Flp pilus assembly protein TadG
VGRRVVLKTVLWEDGGGSLVEFAFVLLGLLMAMFCVVDFSLSMYAYHFVSYAAQEGTRYAMVRGADWPSSCASAGSYDCRASSANITSFVQGLTAPGLNASNITVTPSWPELTVDGSSTGCNTTATENSKGCMVKVQVSYSFHFIMPLFPTSALTMTSTSQQVIAY